MFDRVPDAQLVADLAAALDADPSPDPLVETADLIDQAAAWQRVASWVEASRLDVMRRFEAARIAADDAYLTARDLDAIASKADAGTVRRLRRLADAAPEAACRAGRFAADELAIATGQSMSAVQGQLLTAQDLHRVHREVRAGLVIGELTPFTAMMLCRTTSKLPEDGRRLLDGPIASDAAELTPGAAIEAARNRVAEADAYAEAARQAAKRDARAFLKPLDHGMAMVGVVTTADRAALAYETIDRRARRMRRSGDARNLDQLRADSAIDALTQLQPASEQWPAEQPIALQVTIALSSLLGLDSRNGLLDGYGAITPEQAREIAASGDVTVTRLLCDPLTGGVVHADPTRYRPSAGLRHAVVCRDRHCRDPICSAKIRHLDHIQARADGGLTTSQDLQGLCERSHLKRHHPGWRVRGNAHRRISWTTPTGRTLTSRPPPATGFGTGPPTEIDGLATPDIDHSWPQWLADHTEPGDAGMAAS